MVKNLEKAGAKPELAEAVAAAFAEFGENVATRDDLNHLESRVAIRMDELEKRFNDRIDGLKQYTDSRIEIMRQRLLIQLGGLMFVLFGLFFALLQMFPPGSVSP